MSATSTTGQWSPEVLTYAREQGVEEYLGPLRLATLRVYPTARELRVFRRTIANCATLAGSSSRSTFPLRIAAISWSRPTAGVRRAAVCPSTLFHHFVLSGREEKP